MSLSSTEIAVLSKLLERTLALPPPDRESFIAALPAAQQKLVPRLRERLAQLETPADPLTQPLVPARPPTPRPASRQGERVGPYRLLAPLGAGTDGPLWQAERVVNGGSSGGSTATRQLVALMLSEPGAGAGERQLVRLPQHPNTVSVHDAGVDEHGRFYRVMAWVEGSDLLAHAARRGLSVAQRVQLFLPAIAALAASHAGELAHGELRPTRLRVDEEGRLRLLDWGLGRTLTAALRLAEERALAEVLRALLAAARGTPGSDLSAVLRSALGAEGAPRYDGLDALTADLQRVLQHRPVAVAPASALHGASLFMRRNRWQVGASAVAVAVCTAGLAWGVQQLRRGQHQDDRFARAEAFLAQALPAPAGTASPAATGVAAAATAAAADLTLLAPQLQGALEQARTGFDGEPVLRGLVIAAIGQRFGQIGLPEQALAVSNEALALLKATARSGDAALHATQAQVATQLLQSGRADAAAEARALAQQALAGCASSAERCQPVRAQAEAVLRGGAARP